MIYSMILDWKEFSINLDYIESFLKDKFAEIYAGNSANQQNFILWFSEDPSEDQKKAIYEYWDSIKSDSAESNYISNQRILDRVVELKKEILTKPWDKMDEVDKKIILQLPVSNAELGF